MLNLFDRKLIQSDTDVRATDKETQFENYPVTFDGYDHVQLTGNEGEGDAYWSLPSQFLGNIVSL